MLKLAKAVLLGTAVASTGAVSRGEQVPAPTATEPQFGVEEVLGYWLTEKEGAVIQLYRCDGEENELCGRIAWLKDPYTDEGELKRDPENPVEGLRDRPLCGMQVVTNLSRMDGDTWAYGRVYNPKDGNDYRAYIEAKEDDTLLIRGYIGIPLLGKSETWTRPQGIDIGCPKSG